MVHSHVLFFDCIASVNIIHFHQHTLQIFNLSTHRNVLNFPLLIKRAGFEWLNPFMPVVPKKDLTILVITLSQSHVLVNIWKRNAPQSLSYNSRSNILWIYAYFQSHFQKYHWSRQHFPNRTPSNLSCFSCHG